MQNHIVTIKTYSKRAMDILENELFRALTDDIFTKNLVEDLYKGYSLARLSWHILEVPETHLYDDLLTNHERTSDTELVLELVSSNEVAPIIEKFVSEFVIYENITYSLKDEITLA